MIDKYGNERKNVKVGCIDYVNKGMDYKPTCWRCGWSKPVWTLDDEWVCEDCLTDEEIEYILNYYNSMEKVLNNRIN